MHAAGTSEKLDVARPGGHVAEQVLAPGPDTTPGPQSTHAPRDEYLPAGQASHREYMPNCPVTFAI